jgi:hypothetical protein
MATQAEVIRQNQAREIERQIAAGSFGAPQVEQVTRGIPSNGNDAALHAHLKETRDKSAEYARIQTEADREIWEEAVADNFRRDQEFKDLQKARAGVETMNRAASDMAAGQRLFSQLDATIRSIPTDNLQGNAEDAYRIPLDKLKDLSETTQKIHQLTGVDVLNTQEQQAPKFSEAFPDGQKVHVTQNQDGTLHVEYATGERFDGDALTVTQRIGEAHVNTKVWARSRTGQAQTPAQQSQQSAEPMQLNQQPGTQPLTASGSLADDLAARQADALARQFGFSDKSEMMQWGETVNQKIAKVEQFEEQELAARFLSTAPDFPNTPETAETVMQIIHGNGWQPNLQSLQAAHALAVRNGLYQPLSSEQIQIANGVAPQQQHRQAAPPMLRTSNPELSSQQANDPWNMSMQDLRKAAIAQELDRNSPGYR